MSCSSTDLHLRDLDLFQPKNAIFQSQGVAELHQDGIRVVGGQAGPTVSVCFESEESGIFEFRPNNIFL